MDLHEFQAKRLLSGYGVVVPQGQIAATADEVFEAAEKLGGGSIVVKAQVHAGGRGLAGGVRIVDSPDAARKVAQKLLGKTLVTDQTGPRGRTIRQVYVEHAIEAVRTVYCAVLINRREGKVTLIGAAKGGDDIEERVAHAPGVLEQLCIDPKIPLKDHDFTGFAERIDLKEELTAPAVTLFQSLVRAFHELDASLIEINPLAITEDNKLIALDAKLVIDDNALYHHEDLAELRDMDELDPIELQAQRHDLNFVRLDGNIGMIVNGAGLALATNDMLIDAGGRPANFMDIRTSATSTQIAKGIDLVFQDPNVRVLLVNIHGGGLTRCDTVADAIGISRRRTGSKIPIIFRAAGTNEEFAHTALKNYGVPYVDCKTISEAVTAAVSLVKKAAA